MRTLKSVAFALTAVLLASWSRAADIYECNYDPCWVRKIVVRSHVNCPYYSTTFTCEHYLTPTTNPCVSFNDHWEGDCWVSYSVDSDTWIPLCGYVVAISGLPEVVCAGETYEVTAESSGLPLSQGVVWFGDATIVSQSGNTAVVQFPVAGGNKTLFARAPNQTQSTAYAPTIAVTVTYRPAGAQAASATPSGLQFPDRGGPPSVPLNSTADVVAQLSHDIGTGKLYFKISGQSDTNGRARFEGNNYVTGTGGVLRLFGTLQTSVPGANGSYSGRLVLSTKKDDAASQSLCSPSVGFSVCAHPIGNYLHSADAFEGGLNAYHRWYSDSGTRTDLTGVSVSENIDFVAVRTAAFAQQVVVNGVTHYAFETQFPEFSGYQPIGNVASRLDEHRTGQAQSLINLFNQYGSGTYEDHQYDTFYCARCGMSEETAQNLPQSGFKIVWTLSRPANSATRIELKVEKIPAIVTTVAPGRLDSRDQSPAPSPTSPPPANNPTTHVLQP